MSGSIASVQYQSRVTANFYDGPRHFFLPTGATLSELAGCIECLGLQCEAAPLTISIEFGTAVPAMLANAEARKTRHVRLH